VRKRAIFAKYGPHAWAMLDALLRKYQDDALIDLSDPRVLQLPPLDRLGTLVELIRPFGLRAGFEQAALKL
jgi:type I restriction enzyme R subunit